MKIQFIVTLDWDPMKRLDLAAVAEDIRGAVWELQPEGPKGAIKVLPLTVRPEDSQARKLP